MSSEYSPLITYSSPVVIPPNPCASTAPDVLIAHAPAAPDVTSQPQMNCAVTGRNAAGRVNRVIPAPAAGVTMPLSCTVRPGDGTTRIERLAPPWSKLPQLAAKFGTDPPDPTCAQNW